MPITSFFSVTTLLYWLAFAYVLYTLIASSLPCLARGRKQRCEEVSPFDSVRYTDARAQGPDRIALLESPIEGLGLRLKLFESAQETLDVVCHTIHTGPSTSAFFDGIVQAAERGVRVRILLDGKASSIRPSVGALMRVLSRHPNITCRRYNPVHVLKPWKWHFLMHDKYIVADGQYLLLGGRNIGDKFFAPDGYAGKVSNDRDVIVWKREQDNDSAVDQAAGYFEAMWRCPDTAPMRSERRGATRRDTRSLVRLHDQALRFALDNPAYVATAFEAFLERTMPTRKITLLYNPMEARRKSPWIWQQMCRIAMGANHSVLLQTPYMTANRGILDAMEGISSRVDLSVLTNSAASTPNFPAFSNYYAKRRSFVATGARFFEYQSAHSIHGKAMVVDGRMGLIGSFNMDDRSMHLDTEIMLVVDSDDFAGRLADAIGAYQAQSLCVGEGNRYMIPEGAVMASVPAYKVPLLRVVSVFSLALRSFI